MYYSHHKTGIIETRSSFRLAAVAAAALLVTLTSGGAHAFEFDTGNDDLSIRWDNTLRYNYANRVANRDPKIGNSAVSDEGTYSFNTGDTVQKPSRHSVGIRPHL